MSQRLTAGATVWGHAEDELPENWCGDFATSEEAIADGRRAYEGRSFRVARGTVITPSIDAGDVIELLRERVADDVFWVDEPVEVLDGAREALDRYLTAWVRRYVVPQAWVVDYPFNVIEVEAEAP